MPTKIQSFVRKALTMITPLSIVLFGIGNLSLVHAQGEIPLFTEINTPNKLDTEPPQAAIRSRTVGINLDVLSGPQGDLGSPSLKGDTIQMNLFDDAVEKLELYKAVDDIKNQFGSDLLTKASAMRKKSED